MSKVSRLLDVPSDGSEPEIVLTSEKQQTFSEAVAKGVAQGKSGEAVVGEAVFKWLASWGTDNELPQPLPGQSSHF